MAQVNLEGVHFTRCAARNILSTGTEGENNELQIIWKKQVLAQSWNSFWEDSERPRESSFKIASVPTEIRIHYLAHRNRELHYYISLSSCHLVLLE